jgi:hypothetical protein
LLGTVFVQTNDGENKAIRGQTAKKLHQRFLLFIAEYFKSVCVANKCMTLYPCTISCLCEQTNAAGAGEMIVLSPEEENVVSFLATQSLAHGFRSSSMKEPTKTLRLKTTDVITTCFSTADKLFQAQKKSGQIHEPGVNESARFRHANMKLTTEQVVHIYEQKKKQSRGMAARLANDYGVRAKTIRDIWTHRTHVRVTSIIGSVA